MTTTASTDFISTASTGENWRDISKKALEQLETFKTEGFKPNVGFIYMTEELAADASSILTLFRSVTGVENWSGCAALGVCANGEEFIRQPALSVLIGQIPADQVRAFHAVVPNFKKLHSELEPWLNRHDPMLTFVHVDSFADTHPAQALEEIDAMVGGFMVGGLASAQKESAIIGREVTRNGISGFVFSQDVAVATGLSQGCVPMGPSRQISKGDDHVVAFLSGRVPFEVFSEDMSAMAEKRLGYKPGEQFLQSGNMTPELTKLLSGETHAAFPVTGTDQRDFMVRNIVAIDPETGVIAVGEALEDNQEMMFVYRDDETVRTDLSATLVALRKRVLHERGEFKPKAALYVSCVARMNVSFGGNGMPGGEMALVKEILGDIPITGFYANGEISNNRLYGYTGVIALFL
jgi:small ligand-binding sensory domain FIST